MIYKRRYNRFGVLRTAFNGFHDFLWHEGKNHYTYEHMFGTGEDGMSIAQKRLYNQALAAREAEMNQMKATLTEQQKAAMAAQKELSEQRRRYLMYGGGLLLAGIAYSQRGRLRSNPGVGRASYTGSKVKADIDFTEAIKAGVAIGAIGFGAFTIIDPVPFDAVVGAPLLYGGLKYFGVDPVLSVTGLDLKKKVLG